MKVGTKEDHDTYMHEGSGMLKLGVKTLDPRIELLLSLLFSIYESTCIDDLI